MGSNLKGCGLRHRIKPRTEQGACGALDFPVQQGVCPHVLQCAATAGFGQRARGRDPLGGSFQNSLKLPGAFAGFFNANCFARQGTGYMCDLTIRQTHGSIAQPRQIENRDHFLPGFSGFTRLRLPHSSAHFRFLPPHL
jgi:hypothetical protein